MKKKQTKHFVPDLKDGMGIPACQCFNFKSFKNLPAFEQDGEIAKTRREVTCGNCRRTRIFRKLK